jgi:RHS repeat-associated protein
MWRGASAASRRRRRGAGRANSEPRNVAARRAGPKREKHGSPNLQKVDYLYDESGRLTHINTPGEMECYLEEEFCEFELTFTRGNTASCTELIAVEVNGNVYTLSSSINILAGNAMPPVAEQIESAIEEALDAYGLFGEASVTISFHLFPSPPHRKFTITVTNSNASSLKLLFEGCVKPEEFTKSEDCCEPGAAPVAGDGGLLGPGNPDLFYEHITYSGLDISRIDMGSNCMTGFMRNEYKYDDNHRLINVRNTFFMPEPVVGLFNSSYTYDLAGNLLTLKRFGLEDPTVMVPATSPFLIDDLDYMYPTGLSRLDSVIDLTGQPQGFIPQSSGYGYDAAGNLTTDNGKGLTIDYNLLNLPGTITHSTDGAIRYAYTFGGHKFLKETELEGETPETRLYLGGAEFVNGQPESYYHGEGRVALTGDKPQFQYKLTDHLGNTMVLFEDKDGDGIITTESMSSDPAEVEVLQRNFYYAFGLPMQGPWNHTPTDPAMPYLYNGKELEGELGLGWYAYGFRYYDASVGRFVGVDPLADHPEQIDKSTYAYGWNAPVYYTDPDGRCPRCFFKGIWRGVSNTVVGLYQVVRHPFETAESLGNAVMDPIGTSEAISEAISDRIGEAQSTEGGGYELAGELVFELATVVITATKISKISKISKLKKNKDVIFSADLSKSKAKTRSGHSKAGNKQLHDAMSADSKLSRKMKKVLGDDVYDRTSTSGKGRRNPKDHEWDHNNDNPNQLDLRSKESHAKKTAKDPGRAGGYSKYWKDR